jgi:threonine/homoserine/homoserine lactone efflux protein
MESLFVKGLIVGFALAAPVGPIAALCVQRTITQGWLYGMASGVGAAAADAMYGTLAAFGATYLSNLLMTERPVLQKIGGAVLILIGIRLWLTKPAEGRTESKSNGKGLVGDFASTLVLTLTNPMTFVAFAAVFTTFGIHAVRGDTLLTVELVGGVFTGSLLWWSILCLGAHLLRAKFNYKRLIVANRATGVFVILVGLVYLFLKTG